MGTTGEARVGTNGDAGVGTNGDAGVGTNGARDALNDQMMKSLPEESMEKMFVMKRRG